MCIRDSHFIRFFQHTVGNAFLYLDTGNTLHLFINTLDMLYVDSRYNICLLYTSNWMFSAYTDKAYRWFHSGPSNHWFRSYGLGVSLRCV